MFPSLSLTASDTLLTSLLQSWTPEMDRRVRPPSVRLLSQHEPANREMKMMLYLINPGQKDFDFEHIASKIPSKSSLILDNYPGCSC